MESKNCPFIEPKAKFTYLTKQSELVESANFLSQQSRIAIDLEFDKNRFGYGFNLCLMQIYADDQCFLIDPLQSEVDVSVFFPLLENPNIQKITFSFGEDIRLLHHLGCFPKGIYDLSFATALLDYPPMSLSNLILEKLSFDVGKSSQNSNWLARPITHQQLEYAAHDVLHLINLYEILETEAGNKGLSEWIRQENRSFESSNYENEDHNVIIKEKDKDDLTEFEWFLFCELMRFREEKARELNKSSHSVIQKTYLQELARNPKRVTGWMRIRSTAPELKTEQVEEDVKILLNSAIADAVLKNLSTTKKAIHSLSKDEHERIQREKRQIEKIKKRVFKPIQNELTERFGKNAQTFILSNRLIKDLAKGKLENYLPYKKDLFESISAKLDLDLAEVIGSV